MIFSPTDKASFHLLFRNRTFVIIMGIAGICFFGLCSVIFLLNLLGFKGFKRYGLKIDETGITENANNGSILHIPWCDINEVKISSLFNQKFLTIVVKNPADYIDKQGTLAKRKAMQANYNMTGSPINISTNALNTKLGELKAIIETKLKEYKEKTED